MTISMDKKYRTRDGRKVRIYAVDCCEPCTVHGAVKTECGWLIETWKSDGRWLLEGREHNRDLIEVKPRIKRTV